MGKKVYLAKHALSLGIKEEEIDDKYKSSDSFVWLKGYYGNFRVGKEVFYEKKDAIIEAEKMRIKKIESLKKQIKKLENLKFE